MKLFKSIAISFFVCFLTVYPEAAPTNTVSTNGAYTTFVPKGTTYTSFVDSIVLPFTFSYHLYRDHGRLVDASSLLTNAMQNIDFATMSLKEKDSIISNDTVLIGILSSEIGYWRSYGANLEKREKILGDMNKTIILIAIGSFVIGVGLASLAVYLAAQLVKS